MSAEPKAAPLDEIDDDQPGGFFLAFPRRFCFVTGTHIATLRGEMPAEQLREGDHIRAKKGSFHTVTDVMTVGYDDLPPEAQAQIGLYPVKRGAIEEGLPRRDIYMTSGQQFHLSRRLEIAHAIRMAVKKEGAALRGFRFVLFACPGLPMIRAEGVWTTLTPIERVFPMPGPTAEPGDTAEPEAPAAPAPAPAPRARTPRPRSVMLAPASRAPDPGPAAVPLPPEPAPPARHMSDPAPSARRVSAPPAPLLRAPEPPAPPRRISEPVDAVAPPALLSPRPPAPEGPRRPGRRPPTRFLRTPITLPGVTDPTPEA